MGSRRPGVPLDLALRLRDVLRLGAAVETGTYRGDTAALLGEHFDGVWTVELSETLWREAMQRHESVGNVTFLHGPSQDVLPHVTHDVAAPALYWLDGHWSGDVTAGEDSECPVLAEIAAINAADDAQGSAVLIDDARFFAAPPPPPHKREQWPSLMEVCDAIRQTDDRYVTVLEDVIIGVPSSARRAVEDWGTSVQVHSCPVVDWKRMARVIDPLRRRGAAVARRP